MFKYNVAKYFSHSEIMFLHLNWLEIPTTFIMFLHAELVE